MIKNYKSKKEINDLCYEILNAAIEVHKHLGPGLLESIYEKCLIFELESRGLYVQSQVTLPLIYKGHFLDTELKLDLLVEETVIVELKAIEKFIPINEAQILSHLHLLDLPKGLLLNFKCTNIMKEGQKTMVTRKYFELPDGY